MFASEADVQPLMYGYMRVPCNVADNKVRDMEKGSGVTPRTPDTA